MAGLSPCAHRELVRKFKALRYDGPFAGGKHLFMTGPSGTVTIPNPHSGDIGVGLLARILKSANIPHDKWIAA
ncbi:MAG: type II toxin-antitoxin system HicA family toxin [Candidatus Binataceae bacterium]